MSSVASEVPRQLAAPRYGARVTAVLIVALGALLAVIGCAVSDTTSQIVYGSLCLFLIGIAGAVIMSGRRGLRHSLASGQLGPYLGLSTATIFGLASLTWTGPAPSGQGPPILRSSVLFGMAVVGVALGCFTIGYRTLPVTPPRGVARWLQRVIVTDRPVRSGQGAAWLLLTAAILGYAAAIVNGTFGYLSNAAVAVSSGNPLSQLLATISSFSVFAVALSANDYARQRGSWRLLSLGLLLTANSGLGAFSGGKELVALGFVAAFFGYAATARRLPLLPLAVGGLIFTFVIVPFVTSYRNAINVDGSRLSPALVLQQVSQQGIAFFLPAGQGGAQLSLRETVQRISRVGDVAIIVQKTPSVIGDRPLSELLEAPILGLVPRVLWPDKPILATGYLFSQQYYELPPSVYTSSAVTPEGDLWRHGGWPVLVVGMLLLGVGVRTIDHASSDISGFPLRLFLVMSFFPLLVKQEADVVSLLASLPSLLFGVALAAQLTIQRRRTVLNESGLPQRPAGMAPEPERHRS